MIKERIQHINNKVTTLAGERNLLRQQLNAITNNITKKEGDLDLHKQTRQLLELFVKSTEHNIKSYIEPTITEALEFVFSQYLKFHIVFFNRRNQVEIDFAVIRNPAVEQQYQEYITAPDTNVEKIQQLVKESKDINYMYGGAINQTIATILQLVLVELLHIKGPIFLDEPSSAVSEEYSTKLGHLLSSLSRKFNRQYILITHSNSLASYADKTYNIMQVAGYSQASLVGENEIIN